MAAHLGEQGGLQIGAPHQPVGRTIARCRAGKRNGADFPTGARRLHANGIGHDDVGTQKLFKTEVDQHPRRVRRELQTRAGFLKFVLALQNEDAISRRNQRKRSR